MELKHSENISEFNPDERTEDTERLEPTSNRHENESSIRPVQSGRGKVSAPVTYSLLGLSILMSVVALGTTVIMVRHMFSDMKISDAGFLKELSQWKSNVTANFQKIRCSLGEIQAVVSKLRENLSLGQPFNQWRLFNQKLYFFSSIKQTWDEAQNFCVSMNSTLLVINSAEEQDYIQWYRNCKYWIGLNTAEEGTWRWVDGTDYASNVKFWARSQPNAGEPTEEDCAVVSEDGSWRDWPCSSEHFLICEKPAH